MVNFEDGELVKGAYVVIDGKEYEVHMPQYSGKTPLSSENLNKMQKDLRDNIENAINGTVLYESETGSKDDIILRDTSENYIGTKIYYHYGEVHGSTEVYEANGKIISLIIAFSIPGYNLARMQYKNIKITQNKITNEGYGYLSINTEGKTDVNIQENTILIDKVIGFNKRE